MKKIRFLSLTLALLMLFSAMPTVALAMTLIHDHHWVLEPNDSYPSTCLEPGLRCYYCDICYDTYYMELLPLGHDWGEWIIDQPGTCQSMGSRHRICNRDASHVDYGRYEGDHV